jgi:hypothetical protein
MTTIVALQGDGFALVSCDSRISDVDSSGYISQVSTLKEGTAKVALNGKYLLGAAGDLRAINILHHAFTPPPPPAGIKGKKLDQFFTVKFIPALRECFESQGYATPDKDEKMHMAEHDSLLIVAVCGNIYVVDGDYSWLSDTSGVYALGSGSSYALGALTALMPKTALTVQTAKKTALKAMSIASRFDPHTGSPFHTFVQENQ